MREGGFSPYTSHVRGGGDKDGQREHIISPSWDFLHLSDHYSCKTRFATKHKNLSLLFCDWGRLIKPSFYFPSDTVGKCHTTTLRTDKGLTLASSYWPNGTVYLHPLAVARDLYRQLHTTPSKNS
jgi:hypothetical protein